MHMVLFFVLDGLSQHLCLNPALAFQTGAGFRHLCRDKPVWHSNLYHMCSYGIGCAHSYNSDMYNTSPCCCKACMTGHLFKWNFWWTISCKYICVPFQWKDISPVRQYNVCTNLCQARPQTALEITGREPIGPLVSTLASASRNVRLDISCPGKIKFMLFQVSLVHIV